MFIRTENDDDHQNIRTLIKQTFLGVNEANLVEEIRHGGTFVPELSLVFEKDNQIIGHIIFSTVKIKTFSAEKQNKVDKNRYLVIALLTVSDEYKEQGVGKSLVDYGLDVAKKMGYDAVFAFSCLEFYKEFGFKPMSDWDIFPPFEIDDNNSALVLEFNMGVLVPSIIEFSSEFDGLYSHECQLFKKGSV